MSEEAKNPECCGRCGCGAQPEDGARKPEGECCCGKESCGCGEKAQESAPETAEDLRAQLEKARAEAAANYDLYVREAAELQNTRRRCADDVLKASKFAIDKFAQGLLPVMDSLEKAIELTKDTEGPMREGLLATHRQMLHALEAGGMTPIESAGAKFDPALHQAVCMVPAAEGQEAGMVAQVFQQGWKLHERVLRPAMVAVAQG